MKKKNCTRPITIVDRKEEASACKPTIPNRATTTTYDDGNSTKENASQLDKHFLLECLLALSEMLDAGLERVHGPREERR